MTPSSVMTRRGDMTSLALATGPAMTPQGLLPASSFYAGGVVRPDVVAAGLLAVADVAGSSYADLGVAARIRAYDPVVTAGGDRLRFESFSACNGVHARFDLLATGLTDRPGFGTTNVDVNQPLRTALARVGRSERLRLAVGSDSLTIATQAEEHVEPKVALPDRWVRGLAEVSTLLHGMTKVGALTGPRARRFLGSLPRTGSGPDLHVLPLPGGWRTTPRATPTTVGLGGAARLRGADRVLRHTIALTLHRHRHGSSAWVFDLPGGRLTLALTPGRYRGFSGEGTLLGLLTHPEAETAGRRLVEALRWTPVIDPDTLTATTGLDVIAVRAGLAWLGASGRVGYDLAEAAWFHRDLPVDAEAVVRRTPRLASARRLVERPDGVLVTAATAWSVRGSQADLRYAVRADRTAPGGLRCSCPWETEHRGARGPCKHVLAVILWLRASQT